MSRDETASAAAPTYTMGYGPEFRKTLERRNAADCAAHLLPHLRIRHAPARPRLRPRNDFGGAR